MATTGPIHRGLQPLLKSGKDVDVRTVGDQNLHDDFHLVLSSAMGSRYVIGLLVSLSTIFHQGYSSVPELHLTTSFFPDNKYTTPEHAIHRRETMLALVANTLNPNFHAVHVAAEQPDCGGFLKELSAFRKKVHDRVAGPDQHMHMPKLLCYPFNHQPDYFEMLTLSSHIHLEKAIVHVVANADTVFDDTIVRLRGLEPGQGVLLTINSGPEMDPCYSTGTEADRKQYGPGNYLKHNMSYCIKDVGDPAQSMPTRRQARSIYHTFMRNMGEGGSDPADQCDLKKSNGGFQWCRYPDASSWDALAFSAPSRFANWDPLYQWTSNKTRINQSPVYMNQEAAEFRARCGLEGMGYQFFSGCTDIMASHWHCGAKMHNQRGTSAVQRHVDEYQRYLECRAIPIEQSISSHISKP